MPTRRIFQLTVITVVLIQPVFSMVALWAHRKLATAPADSLTYDVAEVAMVLA